MFPMMHSRLLLICCVVYSAIWVSSAYHDCGPYERPVECIDQCQTCEYKNGGCAQPAVCIKGCDCIPGFFRNKQKQCIPAAFCPDTGPGPSQQCPPNEFPVECVDRCQRCEYKNGNCGQGQACTPGCNCVPGFLRDKTNKCIPANLCPDQCKSDEQYYSDIPDCKNTCENYNNPRAICPQYFAPRPGCFCAIGLVKRQDGKCVKPANCFPQGPPQQCPAGEFPVECIDRCQRCEYKNGNCSQIQICTPGCNCLPGFLRDSTNKCIPADFCPGTGPGPAQQCPAGEFPVECVDRCQRCEYKNGNCGQGQACTPGCNCVPGFLRDKTNKCIPANLCPDQCKCDEQYYSDIPDCKNTCENYNNPGAICPKYFAPRPGCFCAVGLVKRKDGKCVKPENCFPPAPGPAPAQQCGQYERPVECIDQCQTCEYKNGGCAQPAVCIPGCDCIPGFFRNKQKQCIPATFCPAPIPTQQCGVYERPVECIDQCQTCKYKNGGCVQPAVCIPGCDCIPGFFRNEKNQCVPAALCPGPSQQCPAGEFPVECIDRCQRCEYKNGNCSQIQVCTPGCNCVPGFLRDSTNKCIPADYCPGNPCLQEKDSGPCYGYFPRFYYNKKTGRCEKFIYGGCKGNSNNFEHKKLCKAACKGTGPGPAQQCPPYEYPVECIDKCQTCEYKNGHCIQTAECTPGCNCVPGFLRDSTKKCIPASRCP